MWKPISTDFKKEYSLKNHTNIHLTVRKQRRVVREEYLKPFKLCENKYTLAHFKMLPTNHLFTNSICLIYVYTVFGMK